MPPLAEIKHEFFVQELIVCHDPSQAYIKIYGYSADARHAARKLMDREDVADRIRELMEELASEKVMKATEVLETLSSIARVDIKDIVEWDQESVKFKDSKLVDGKMIAQVAMGRDGLRVKPYDKMEALKNLGLYHKLFTEQVQQQIPVAQINAETAAARERLKKKKEENRDDS